MSDQTVYHINRTILDIEQRIGHLRRRWCYKTIDEAIGEATVITDLAGELEDAMATLRDEEKAAS